MFLEIMLKFNRKSLETIKNQLNDY